VRGFQQGRGMRIIFFIHSLSSGGAERVTATLANYWAERKWSVTVVTMAGSEHDFYSLDDRIQRLSLGLNENSSTLWYSIINNLRRVYAVRRVLKNNRPDVAVAMMSTANATLALAGCGLRVPTVGSERTYPPAIAPGRGWELIRRLSYRLLSALVAQTYDSADWLKMNARSRRIEVIPNPLSFPLPVQEPIVSPVGIRDEMGFSCLLLAVGRLGGEKGFDRLLDVFARIRKDHPDWALVILGEGSQRDSLEAQARSLGLDDCVRFPGVAGNMCQWYEAADAYVLTSRFEGFPNALIEAMAYGAPAVAVDCKTGPREIIRHEIDGLLVPQDDSEKLFRALDRLMKDVDLRACCARRAIEVRQRFSVERVAERWETLFAEILESEIRGNDT
jgi:glycosyltransferase involved in cell wall biosynthesis